MDKSLLLAAEDSDCLSTRLRAKAQALRNLSVTAKNWEHDMKRASQNLKQKVENKNQFKPPSIQITPPLGHPREYQPSPAISDTNSEIDRIRKQLRSFVFDDKGEPSLLRQQLGDYQELRKQL